MSPPPSATLTIVVNFHNMRREAPRTLVSLLPGYQRDVGDLAYEVVAVDNGSTTALGEDLVRGIDAARCRYEYVATASPSPAAAINDAVRRSSAEWIMCLIDGARMVSPGTVAHGMRATRLFPEPFVYTLAMHLGPEPQNASMLQGYDQAAEDRLLAGIDWRNNGYALFEVSSVALSSRQGFFSDIVETNCFIMRRERYLALGGLCEAFQSPGGGLVNLDFFNRVHEAADIAPVMLLGEATFHQFHGGVATNVPLSRHPGREFAEEYRRIRGRDFQTSVRPPVYFGGIPPECRRFVRASTRGWGD
ncbi:MAG: glycosyltransferase family A protein [Planctomycetia bacterium]